MSIRLLLYKLFVKNFIKLNIKPKRGLSITLPPVEGSYFLQITFFVRDIFTLPVEVL